MSVTVTNLITNLDSNIGDTSTDRVSTAERYQYLTEAVVWLKESLGNDHENETYNISYYDTVHYYKVTTAVADLLDAADLRRGEMDQTYSFPRKSSRELAEEIGQGDYESAYAIERRDSNAYVVINHRSKYSALDICTCDSLDFGGGTWEVDATNSDATNLTIDENEVLEGTGSFNFDVDVSQSGNNRATIQNTDLDALDISEYENLSAFIFDVYLPSVVNFSSITFYWGSDTTNYWSATVTTDYNGSAFAVGWNRIKINWSDATATLSPDSSAVTYVRFDFNYTGSQTDFNDYRIDFLRLARPEKLVFHYISWKIGTNNSGTDLFAFTAGTDIPYFSGQYDQYKFAVAHKAASLCFRNLRLFSEADREESEAEKALKRVQKFIPSSRTPEVKSFKVGGINLARRRGRRSRR